VTVRPMLPVLLALAAAPVACRDDGPCGVPRCDVRQTDCQQRIAEAAACLRGVDPIQVPIIVVDRDRYREQAANQPLDPAEAERWRMVNLGLSLLGLSDENVALTTAVVGNTDYTGAFYSYSDRAITLIASPDVPMNGGYMVTTLIHEYIHALQHAAGRIGGPEEVDRSLDRSLASAALIEGEADLISDLAMLDLHRRDESDIPWTAVFDRARALAHRDARNDELPIERSRAYFAYPYGAAFIYQARSQGGYPAVEAAFATPPRTTREVMAGFGAAEPAGGPWSEDMGDDAEPVLPAGFVRAASDRLGAFALRLFLAGWGPWFDRWRKPLDPAADDLRSDHITIQHVTDPASPLTPMIVTTWRLRFGSAETAARLARTLTRPDWEVPQWWHEARDRDVIIVASRGMTPPLDPTKLTWRAVPPDPGPMPDKPNGPGTMNDGLPVLPSAPSCSMRSAGSFPTP
jgi:hypothetical protein